MLTEPRKYWLTIIGVANNWKMIDSAFRTSTDDWFLFSKTWKWWFERMKCTHLWVHDGEFNYDNPIVLDTKQTWIRWDKAILLFRTLYWTWEIVWWWGKDDLPHRFIPGMIYDDNPMISDPAPVARSILPLIKPVPVIEEVAQLKLPKPRKRKAKGPKDNALDSEWINI